MVKALINTMDISRRFVVVFLVLLILVHIFAVFFGWYSNSLIDLTLHFLGGIWSAMFFVLLFRHFISLHLHHYFSEKIKILIIIASFSSLMGVLWELHSFILSEYFPFYLQENMWGVMVGIITAIIGGCVGGWIALNIGPKKSDGISQNI